MLVRYNKGGERRHSVIQSTSQPHNDVRGQPAALFPLCTEERNRCVPEPGWTLEEDIKHFPMLGLELLTVQPEAQSLY